ncbi:hypothetical protein HY734_02020 [Candidatus Uhrbacteria bacterium]|nr:hypothetical protein [Candidatus Uhrbacteria bacterium]
MRGLFTILFFTAACNPPDTTPSESSDLPTTMVATTEELEVDKTFLDPVAVEAWRAGIATIIQADATVPHPRDIWRYAADFHVDRNKSDPLLGDPAIWDAIGATQAPGDYGLESNVPTPTADQALALEAQDKEWDAAQIWITLGRLDDAKRCSKELGEEGEWKAVAMIAVHTGDLESLDRATKHMVADDQITRTREVITYAYQFGKLEAAKHIVKTHDWKLTNVLSPFQVRDLATKGHGTLLLELLNKEIAAWEKNEFSGLPRHPGPEVVVADIALLAKFDPAEAKAYATRYLKLPGANVLIWTECGEGCYSEPVRGSLELYELVRQDKELRELYLARLRQAIDEMFPVPSADGTTPEIKPTINGVQPGSYSGWSSDMWGNGTEGNQLTAYLLRVRQMGDGELTRFWVEMLDTFPNRSGMDGSLEFDRELGRCALGLPFYQSVGDITPSEKFILEDLRGGANTQMSDTWVAWDKEFPTADDLSSVTDLFHILTRGEVLASRDAVIRAELKIEAVPGYEESLRSELESRFRRSLDAYYGDGWALKTQFGKAQSALKTNVAAQGLRRDRGLPVIELYPDTDEELADLVEPSMEALCLVLLAKCTHWHKTFPWPESVPTAEAPEGTTEAPATLAAPATATAVSNCTFINGNRPKVGEKYIVRCEGVTFLATGTFTVDHFVWSDLTPHTP